jgi:sec-independent protein translocase protein TatC
LTDPSESLPSKKESIWDHLGELKRRLKVVAIAYIASIAFWSLVPAQAFDPTALLTGTYRPMIAIVVDNAASLGGGKISIISGSLTAPIEIYFLASAVMALVTSSPVIGYEIFKFVVPALYPNERSLVGNFTTAFVGLFVGGAAVGYFLLTPAVIRFMSYWATIFSIQPVVTAGDYFGMVFITTGATAIAFTTPAIFVLMVQLGIISSSALTKNRLIVYLGLYIVIAALTPEPIVGHFGMFFPIVILLEISAVIARRIEKKRGKVGAGEGPTRKDTCAYCGARKYQGAQFCPSCGRAAE